MFRIAFKFISQAVRNVFDTRDGGYSLLSIIIVVVLALMSYKAVSGFFKPDYEAMYLDLREKQARQQIEEKELFIEQEKKANERAKKLNEEWESQFNAGKYELEEERKKSKHWHDAFYKEKNKLDKLTNSLQSNEYYKKWRDCRYPAELDAHRVRK